MPAETAVPGSRPARRAGGDVDIEFPSDGPPPSQGKKEPPEQNRIGELERLVKKQQRDLEAIRSEKSEDTGVLKRLREVVTGEQKAPPAGPMPDQYDDPDAYQDWLKSQIRNEAESIADQRLQTYDRTRKTADSLKVRDENNDRVTEQFVSTRPWLQSDDGGVNGEAIEAFQGHINDLGIQGKGPGGSLTLRQLEAAERDFRFEEILGEEGSRIQGDTVRRFREGQQARTPRGQSANSPANLADMIESGSEGTRAAANVLREMERDRPGSGISRLQDLRAQDRALARKLLPYLPDASR